MQIQIPRFNEIKDFEAYFNEISKQMTFQNKKNLKDQSNLETKQSQEIFQKKTRSLKCKIQGPQVSFQATFMKQHLQAFNFHTSKYLQQNFVGQHLERKDFLNDRIFPKKSVFFNTQNQIQSYLKSSFCPIDKYKAKMFMEDLLYQQKLYEFLNYICKNSCDQVSFELLFIADQIWEQYIQIQEEQMEYQKLIEYSRKLVEINWQLIKKRNFIKFVTLQKTLLQSKLQESARLNSFKLFIEAFIVTIFLITSEYFANPYYGQSLNYQIKNHSFFNNNALIDQYDNYSEDEVQQQQDYFLKGRKKIKSSEESDN